MKPWIFQEIKEQRHIDISASERLDLLKQFCSNGLEHWGSDAKGVETTRSVFLQLLSFDISSSFDRSSLSFDWSWGCGSSLGKCSSSYRGHQP